MTKSESNTIAKEIRDLKKLLRTTEKPILKAIAMERLTILKATARAEKMINALKTSEQKINKRISILEGRLNS
jgi:ribosomal protein L18E